MGHNMGPLKFLTVDAVVVDAPRQTPSVRPETATKALLLSSPLLSSEMSLLGSAIKSRLVLRACKPNHHGFPLFSRQIPRGLFTDVGPSSRPPPVEDSAAADEFLQAPKSGLVYGKLTGIRKNALKSDILYLLGGCNLTLDDMKVNYTKSFMPAEMYSSAHLCLHYGVRCNNS